MLIFPPKVNLKNRLGYVRNPRSLMGIYLEAPIISD